MKIIFCSICTLLLFTSLSSADEISEVRGDQVLFSLDGLEGLANGDVIEIFDGTVSLGKGKVSKIGKKSALAIVSQSTRPIEKGQKVKINEFDKLLNSDPQESPKNQEQDKKPTGHRWIGEPFANVASGTLEQAITITEPVSGTAKVEGSISGYQLGARGGYIWENLFVGFQYSQAAGEHKELKMTMDLAGTKTTTDLDKMDYGKTDFGLLLGWKFGEMFRMWFSSLNSNLKTKASSGEKTKYKGVTGLLGFGWHIGSQFSINLELGGAIYSEEDGQKYPFTTTVDGVTMKVDAFKETHFLFGLSWCHGLY
ncbi:MAG: hypothetical protein HYV97_04110 [Bdellovibrio sp.]|nr:hypothetical protein [Bdellovibrio sp.]